MSAERLRSHEIAPAGIKAASGVEAYIQKCGLEHSLIELVKMRASQINGCAFCLDMHSKDARRRGVNEQRLYLLDAWAESSLYSPRERAALAWTEAVARIEDTRALDPVYDAVAPAFLRQGDRGPDQHPIDIEKAAGSGVAFDPRLHC
jgi:AhpD family alkylhydroperoxidase